MNAHTRSFDLRTQPVARQAAIILTAAVIGLSSSACSGDNDSTNALRERDAGRNKPVTTAQTAEPASSEYPVPQR